MLPAPSPLPDRDLAILRSVVAFDTVTRNQLTDLHFPDDEDGRNTRKRLRALCARALLNQTNMQVVNPTVSGGVSAPVYYPSAKGLDFLRELSGDESYRLVNATTPTWTTLYHSVAVAAFRILLVRAATLRTDLKLLEHVSERALRDLKATEPASRYRLFTLITQEPYLVCKPDAAFLLDKQDVRRIFYVEIDRDTTKGAERVAAQKCGGYAGLREHRLWTRHFPTANDDQFRVLFVAPTTARRDAIRKAVATKPGAELWRFASAPVLTPASLLSAPVWVKAVGDEAKPLVPVTEQGGAA